MGTRSNFPELGSELLADEPQPEAGMSTQDVARTGFKGGHAFDWPSPVHDQPA